MSGLGKLFLSEVGIIYMYFEVCPFTFLQQEMF